MERKIAKLFFGFCFFSKNPQTKEMNKQNASSKRASCLVAGQNRKNSFSPLSLERGHHESNECREKVKFYKNKLTQGFL